MQNLAERYRLRQFDPVSALLESLLETYREWGTARPMLPFWIGRFADRARIHLAA